MCILITRVVPAVTGWWWPPTGWGCSFCPLVSGCSQHGACTLASAMPVRYEKWYQEYTLVSSTILLFIKRSQLVDMHSFCEMVCTQVYVQYKSERVSVSMNHVDHLNMQCECVYTYCVYTCRYFITWFSSSAGLIFAKSEKSIRVSCLAISSGSKSKIVKRAEVGLAGNYKTQNVLIKMVLQVINVLVRTLTGGGGSRNILRFFFWITP